MSQDAEQGTTGQSVSRDGLAAMAMVVITVVLIAVVIIALV